MLSQSRVTSSFDRPAVDQVGGKLEVSIGYLTLIPFAVENRRVNKVHVANLE